MRSKGVASLGIAMLLLTACSTVETSLAEPAEMPTVAAPEPTEAIELAGPDLVPIETARAYQIDSANSEARFVIDEILGGADNTVVGVSDQIQGELTVDLEDPAGSQMGVIEIDAGSFATDSSLRDRAIRSFILQSGTFGVISFVPTAIIGLPEAVSLGDSGSVQIEGELTIRDVGVPVTFAVDLTLESENRISGFATATISRADFGLTIPEVPRVAGVDDEFILEFEFVAVAG
jgi:polyisoprenoid-binding protein YceI